MKRLLLAAVLLGCRDEGAPFLDDDDYGGTKTPKCCDESPRDVGVVEIDPAIITLASAEDVACMTVDDDAVYWVTREGRIAALQTTDVPSTGPRPATPPDGVRADLGEGPCELVRDGDELWVTSLKEGALHRLTVVKNVDRTVSFGASHDTVTGFDAPTSVAIDATHVYVAEHDAGVVKRFARSAAGADAGGPPATETLATEGTRAASLRLDDDTVYWLSFKAEDGTSRARKVAKTGGEVTTLARAEHVLERIGGALYFFDGDVVRTVSTEGGLPIAVRTGATTAFATDGASLYLAAGGGMSVVAVDGTRHLFTFESDTGARGDVKLFAQPRRLVWTRARSIFTRAVPP
ncbi:MAG: hypothetical protein KIT84_06495 [Labilithrix sp.]|nr:hypothetical protein [Labilithrix sp.]MCW5810642.1 hypothetical protein [Labilithrix sp.]